MRVESNLRAVIGRLDRLKNRDIPAAMRAALRPDAWRELARVEAEATLNMLADTGQKQFVSSFVNTLVASVLADGFFLRLRSPFTGASYGGMTAQTQLPGVGTGKYDALELAPDGQPGDFQEFLGDVVDWVENEKEWKIERDGEKNFETVLAKADWIAYTLISPNLSNVRNSPDAMSEQEARDSLLPVLVDFIKQKHGDEAAKQPGAPLPAPVIDTWLRAVLAAWRRMVCHLFAEKFRLALRAELAGSGS
jgi:hypothetical protein